MCERQTEREKDILAPQRASPEREVDEVRATWRIFVLLFLSLDRGGPNGGESAPAGLGVCPPPAKQPGTVIVLSSLDRVAL